MIHSMTGFGKAEAKSESQKVTVEIRSLNSKQADISLRLPFDLRSEEIEVRKMVAQSLLRGKIDVFVSVEQLKEEPNVSFDAVLAKEYWQKLQDFAAETGIPMLDNPMKTILGFNGVQKSHEESEEEIEALKNLMTKALGDALDHLREFRVQEGLSLYRVFEENNRAIGELLSQTKPFEDERITEIKQRLEDNLKKYIDHEYDPGRLEQEMIFYIEKLDVNEEKNRLKNHLKYFQETMDLPEPGQGRKLGFIAQEMGREINTLGSKSNHAGLQKIVVKMKDHLEQIKEQVLNVL